MSGVRPVVLGSSCQALSDLHYSGGHTATERFSRMYLDVPPAHEHSDNGREELRYVWNSDILRNTGIVNSITT